MFPERRYLGLCPTTRPMGWLSIYLIIIIIIIIIIGYNTLITEVLGAVLRARL